MGVVLPYDDPLWHDCETLPSLFFLKPSSITSANPSPPQRPTPHQIRGDPPGGLPEKALRSFGRPEVMTGGDRQSKYGYILPLVLRHEERSFPMHYFSFFRNYCLWIRYRGELGHALGPVWGIRKRRVLWGRTPFISTFGISRQLRKPRVP